MGKGPEQTFFQRRYMNGQQVREKMVSIIIIIKEMQIKNPREYLTPVRMARFRKTRDDKCWQRCEEKDPCGRLVGL